MSSKIQNESDYRDAVQLLEKLGDDPNFENDDKLINQFNMIHKLVVEFEDRNYALDAGNPIEIIKLKMAYSNLKAKDLVPYIGSKGLVSEVLNLKRPLSKSMIRNVSGFLNISQDILNVEYDLKEKEVVSYEIAKNKRAEKMGNQKMSQFQNLVLERGLLFNFCSPICV